MMSLIRHFLLSLSLFTFVYSHEKSGAGSAQPVYDFQNFNYQQFQYNQLQQDISFYADTKVQSSFGNVSNAEYREILKQAVVHEIVCRQVFHMSIAQKEQMKRLSYDDFVQALLLRDDLSDQAIFALWNEYKEKRWWDWSNEKFENEIEIQDGLEKRRKDREKEERRKQQKEREAQQEAIKRQKMQDAHEQYQRDSIAQQHQYLANMYDISFQSFGNNETSESRVIVRQQALEKTRRESFVQYEQQYCLTPQTQAYVQLQDIDVSGYGSFYGTALQQEFHQEVCDILQFAATLQKDLGYNSNLIFSGVLCADAAYEMNQQENIKSTMSLIDLGVALTDVVKQYGQAICNGVFSSGKDFVYGLVHPDEMILSVGNALYFVLETAALNSYSEEYGFEDLYIPLRDERNKQIIQGLESLGRAIINSTGPAIVEGLVRFGADFFIPGKIMQAVGTTLGLFRSQIKVAKSIEAVGAIAGDSLGAQEVLLDVAKTAEKMEMVAQENIAQKTAQTLLNAEKQFDKSIQSTKANQFRKKGDAPPAVDTRSLLDKNLSIVEEISHEAGERKYLSNGRIRYYKAETAASTPGPTRGFAYVLEYDPVRGMIRGWYEGYTHAGKINRVHPKMINGNDIVSLHYPHTKKELEIMAQQLKRKK